MTTECMTVQGLHAITLLLTPVEKWASAGSYGNPATAGRLLAVLAVITLVVVALVVYRVWTKRQRINSSLDLKRNGLSLDRLEQEQENHIQADTAEEPQQETAEVC